MEEEILRLILRLKDHIYFSQIYDERRFSNKLENKTGTLILQDRTRVLLCLQHMLAELQLAN